jgi:hypothetical protein
MENEKDTYVPGDPPLLSHHVVESDSLSVSDIAQECFDDLFRDIRRHFYERGLQIMWRRTSGDWRLLLDILRRTIRRVHVLHAHARHEKAEVSFAFDEEVMGDNPSLVPCANALETIHVQLTLEGFVQNLVEIQRQNGLDKVFRLVYPEPVPGCVP